MAIYHNKNAASPLTAVEFNPVSDGNFSFFYVDSPLKKDGVKKWLTSPEMGQEIIAEAQLGSHPVIVTHGDKTAEALLQKMADQGDKLVLQQPKKDFDAWKARGALGLGTRQHAGGFLGLIELRRVVGGFDDLANELALVRILIDATEQLHIELHEIGPQGAQQIERAKPGAQIIERHDFGDGRSRYEEHSDDHHDHLIDMKTGKVVEFVDPEIEALQEAIARKLGYRLVDHRLELYGMPIEE